ncbi:hypothetical protein [Hymenobacter siberiensis]|nr:hypothetical protein [Hymenobacter siberiensis]
MQSRASSSSFRRQRKVFEQANYTQDWGSAPDVAAGQTWKGWLEVVK